MKKNYTHVTFVLDNSGSMSHLKNDTIGGYNTFLAKQKEDPGEMTFSLYQFERDYDIGNRNSNNVILGSGYPPLNIPSNPILGSGFPLPCWPEEQKLNVLTTYQFIDLKTVPDLNSLTYNCDTNTPLLDTIGFAIVKTGEVLALKSEEERPEKVIFVILTDGEENASKKYSHEMVTAKIKEQTEVYNWDFIFLGANQDAIQTGQSYGITRGRSMTYAATSSSVGASYGIVSDTVSLMKSAISSKDVNFEECARSSVLDGTYGKED